MAKVYDYRGIVSALVSASQEWSKQGRVTRKTYLRLRVLMSQAVVNRMTGQLLNYQNPMSTQKAIECVLDLPAWRKAYAWARRGDEPRRQAELDKVSRELAAAFAHDPEKVKDMLEAQMRQVGL